MFAWCKFLFKSDICRRFVMHVKAAFPLKGIRQTTIWINYLNQAKKTKYSLLEQIF